MLLLRTIVTLSACWIVKCDLLDLYVQHMDETMRTKLYRNKRHPADPASRIKRNLGPATIEPLLRIGNFKKQRLDVDVDWLRQWKAKKRVFYKNDALDFPNKREDNLDPDQHEMLPTRTAIPEDIVEATSRIPVEPEVAKSTSISAKNETELTQDPKTEEQWHEDAETNNFEDIVRILEGIFVEPLEPEEQIPMNNWKNSMMQTENGEEFDENDGTKPKPFDEPSFKMTPKSQDYTSKKYFPFVEKLVENAPSAKTSYIKDEIESESVSQDSKSEKRGEVSENGAMWWSSMNETDGIEEAAEVGELLEPEDKVPVKNREDEEDFVIISENDRIKQKPFDEPNFKRTPKLRGRTPKKYFSFMEKPAENAREAQKSRIKQETMKTNGRTKRSTRVPKLTRYEKLDENGDVVLEWDPSDDEEVIFKVTARTLGYVGIGFNEKSHMKGADILLAWVDDHTGAVNLLDSHGIEEMNAAPVTDTSQDVRVLGGSQNETHTTVMFSRNWQTCDPQDHRLTGDTVRVLWALHQTDPELNTAIWHGEKRGGRALRLKTAAAHTPPRDIRDIRHWDVKLNQYPVPDNLDTVYWCKIFKAPLLTEKYHMIGYTPLVEKVNEDLVHHIILYECASTAPILGQHARIAGAACYSPTMPRAWESCMQPVLAWARGSKGEWLPEHVGIPIAEHREGTYYMLEVHYNNPSMKKVIDSSGVRLHLTPRLRREEAGILVAGVAVSPLHLVPPRQREYATAGYCTPHCTNTMFPEDGINVVSVVLHSHLAGRRLSLKHIRQGKELPRIVEDNHFDFEYQQSHTLEKEVKVLPGDELVAECVYGTLDRTKPTLGGYAVSQEMCLAFVVHYPKTPLAACYSMTPVKDLFKTLGVYSFKGVTMDHLEKLFLTTGTDSVALPSTSQQQLPAYPAPRPTDEVDETLIKEAESALRAMRDYREESENDNVFARLIIEEPQEFRGRTMAEHMLALPWTEELLARSIERSLYHGRHMTFCRKRDDKLALPADIQTFPNYTALPEANDTTCSELKITSGSSWMPHSFVINLVTIVIVSTVIF